MGKHASVCHNLFHRNNHILRINNKYDIARQDPNRLNKLRRGDVEWMIRKKILIWLVNNIWLVISLPGSFIDKVKSFLAILIPKIITPVQNCVGDSLGYCTTSLLSLQEAAVYCHTWNTLWVALAAPHSHLQYVRNWIIGADLWDSCRTNQHKYLRCCTPIWIALGPLMNTPPS